MVTVKGKNKYTSKYLKVNMYKVRCRYISM